MYRIKNWNKFQHYKDRKPPWIKLHMSLLYDQHYLGMNPKAQLVLIHCWMAAADSWNPSKEVEPLLPAESFQIRSRVVLRGKLYLQEIVNAGFLIPVSNDYNNLIDADASESVAKPYQSATPETEIEKDIKAETASNGILQNLLKDITDRVDFNWFNPYEFIGSKEVRGWPIECHIDILERLCGSDVFMAQEVDKPFAYALSVFRVEAQNIVANMSEAEAGRYKDEIY